MMATVSRAEHAVGIDLGTTNTVVAHVRIARGEGARVVPISQLVAAADIAEEPLLPSVLFAPAPGENAPDEWEDAPFIAGRYARARGVGTPGRAITSPKSWLSHVAVDRLERILPWGADASDSTLPRISPVEASRRLLAHVHRAVEGTLALRLAEAQVVLTVPASFDEVARELTVRAAEGAGLSVRLLEEPVAAFHDYLGVRGTAELESLLEGRETALVLVCDIGGGTTDLTLIRAARGKDGLSLDRVAVGRHLLLGGDNMDLALAHGVEEALAPSASRLDPGRFAELVQACRAAKETLLGEGAPSSAPIRLLSSGSSLVGSTLSAELTRDTVERVVLEGFFPVVQRDAELVRGRSGLVAFGLPYEHDAAITRHLAAFVRRHVPDGEGPHAVLLNGGVFRAPSVTTRVARCLAGFASGPVSILTATDPELAVARGAALFGRSLFGFGARVGGGSARGYYVGLAATDGSRRALSIVPRGSREGERHVVVVPGLSLVVGEPVRFDLFSSDAATHAPGQIVSIDGSLDALPSMTAAFEAEGAPVGSRLPVHLEGELSAVGTLDVACVASEGSRSVRASEGSRSVGASEGSRSVRASEGSRSVGANEGSRSVRASEGSRSVGANEGSRSVGANEGSRSVGANEQRASDAPPSAAPVSLAAPSARRNRQRFRLAFDLRAPERTASAAPRSAARPVDSKIEAARGLLANVFGRGRADADPRDARRLLRDLEKLLGERPTWTTETARALYDALVPESKARRRSAEHERAFWMLAGYCLRPGYGHPLDERRAGKLVPLFAELVAFPDEARSFQQFWIAWRRVAGGLLEPMQAQIRDVLDPFLSTDTEKPKKKKGFKPLAEAEMLELAASLERLPPARREDLGRWILERTWRDRDPRLWTLLAHVGARVPAYASAHHVVPPRVIESWLDHLLREKWNDVPTAPRAALQMARVTGDRARDVSEAVRRDVARRVEQAGQAAEWARAVLEYVPVSESDQTEFFGESLPVGLELAGVES